ncbi:uncharacterized protein [Aegilops tauschii subsp. strangulata]|uniref:uncharacterized protein n=1 Tax=Aegilops tauschii subsp. strangulata TaxID=200361 RepID=UPI00098B5DBC|nr:uncharacterized protein LOC109731647 isoform X1 [Aegilops tauschii subsp. strangulata]XP_020146406.1 uncharacterized protein LOC109731647 isoform X1 [Aegilops tauschii subsp. strangulata]XP_045083857.1 uncharacterized protein LOC109731647 isoform X1 [Aegilops tauschii subsp. strangulata]
MFPFKNSCLHFGLVSALCSLLAFLSVVAALPFGRSFHAQDLANCACAELALEYGLRRRRGPQGHRCCGAGRGFRAVHRPPVLPGEGCNGRDGVEARPCGRRRGASRGGATTTPTAASSPLSTFGRCRGGGLSCGLTGAGAHQRSDLVPIGQIIQPPLLLYNFVDLSGIFSAVWNQHIYLRISRLWYQRGGFDDGPIKSIHVCSSIGKSCQRDGA